MKDSNEILKEAVEVLRSGGVILYPTDTVWGIGCDATDPEAVEKVFKTKGREQGKALVLLASGLDMVGRYVKEIPEMAIQLVEVNDAPMTIIYPDARVAPEGTGADRHFLARNVVAEDGSVGIRIPLHKFSHDLAYRLGRPIVSTSANLSGGKTPVSYKDIPKEIVDAVDYAVPSYLGSESTGKASQILKVGLRGEIQIIRK